MLLLDVVEHFLLQSNAKVRKMPLVPVRGRGYPLADPDKAQMNIVKTFLVTLHSSKSLSLYSSHAWTLFLTHQDRPWREMESRDRIHWLISAVLVCLHLAQHPHTQRHTARVISSLQQFLFHSNTIDSV